MKFLIAAVALTCHVTSACGATLQGQVVNAHGDPIAGAWIDVSTAAPRTGPALFCPSCYLDCVKRVKTDDAGHYRLEGLSDVLKFRMLFTAAGQDSKLTQLIDPLAGDLDVTLTPAVSGPTERTVRGRVLDETGYPVEGALVSPVGAKTSSKQWGGQVDNVQPAVCDDEGRFSMLLPADFEAVDIDISADGRAGIAPPLLKPGVDEREITIPTGTGVTGRLVYRGQPVAGFRIAVVQLNRDSDRHFIGAVPATTDDSGQFSFKYLPANERYAIYTLIGEGATESRDLVLGTKLFTARDNNATRELGDLEARPALHIHGRIELPQGQTLPPNTKLAINRETAWDLAAVTVESDGQFFIEGLPPETYELRVAAKGVEIDSANLHYQLLSPQSLGILIEDSIDELKIPVVQK